MRSDGKTAPQIGGAEHHASGSVTIHIVGQKNFGHFLDKLGMRGSKSVAEPSRDLKLDQSRETFRTGRGGAFTPILGSVFAVPRRRVDQSKRAHAGEIHAGKRLRDAPAHGASRDSGGSASQMIEQFRQVAGEKFCGEGLGIPVRLPVSPAVVGKNLGLAGQFRRDAVPDAAIERQGMDEHQSLRAGFFRGPQRIRDGAVVGSCESFLLISFCIDVFLRVP